LTQTPPGLAVLLGAGLGAAEDGDEAGVVLAAAGADGGAGFAPPLSVVPPPVTLPVPEPLPWLPPPLPDPARPGDVARDDPLRPPDPG